jgi:iron(III) transport system substrate-binding protein
MRVPRRSNTPLLSWRLAGLALLLAAGLAYAWFASRAPAPLVVYCAHDAIYADGLLKAYEKRAGIRLSVRFDSEATKSLGLVELLLRERTHPRCDLFWNNELLGTLQLAEAGLLQPYRGPGYERIPAAFKDPEARWTGFAARLRVWIVNTQRVEAAASAPLPPADLTRTVMAKPLYGTTRTHYTVLWSLWGPERLQAWHRDWRARGGREASGNAAVKNLVAEGVCDSGLTDSDDYFAARDGGKPVAMAPARVDASHTLCIPNTAAIVRGTRRLKAAQALADYLLSAEVETALANSPSRQIPLGPVDEARLPAEVRELKRLAADGYPLDGLDAARRDCLDWLKSEYLR